jgi:hypothetical protein
MRTRLPGPHGQHPVQQHHALRRPGAEIPIARPRAPEVVDVLAEDVLEARRQRPHTWRNREAEADRMPRRRVRVLADDQHPHLVERLLERGQDAIARGQVAAPGRPLAAQEIAETGDHVGDRRQRLRPARADRRCQGALRLGRRHAEILRAGADGVIKEGVAPADTRTVDVLDAMMQQQANIVSTQASVAVLRQGLDLQQQQADDLAKMMTPQATGGGGFDPGRGSLVDRYA